MKHGPLDLSRKRIERVPFEDIPLSTIWLVLSNNRITQIPRDIERLCRIERLALNDNNIVEINEGFKELSRLSWVDMTRNNLKTLPTTLVFNRLVGLGLSENEFEELPECVFNFRALRKFGFFANKIRFVSPKIQNLQNLIKLDLSNNLIEELPEEICTLKNLTWLNISNNNLKRLPSKFGDLVNLEELGLGNNGLESIPSLNNMKRLRVLSIFNNEVTNFEIDSQTIRKIDLSNNRLEKFPSCLLRIPALHTVSLKNNVINEIFLNKTEKSNLRSIDLRFNKLRSIPLKFLKSIEHCQTLLLEGNEFTPKKDFFPEVPTLQSICLNSYTNQEQRIECRLRKRHICDFCCKMFVNSPIKVYFLASLEPEEKFCLEEEVCTNKCYINSIKTKGGRDVFCSS